MQQLAFGTTLLCASSAWAVDHGDLVTNVATVEFNGGSSTDAVTVVGVDRSLAAIEFLRPTSGARGQSVNVGMTMCGGSPVPAPRDGSTGTIPGPVNLVSTASYKAGAGIFVRLDDADQNVDPAVAEYVTVTLATEITADLERIDLMETGPDTGRFVGFIGSVQGMFSVGNCELSVNPDATITASYADPEDTTDTAAASAVVDPFGRVFDSATGDLMDGVFVGLIDVTTDMPAPVFGDDGTSTFPSIVESGGTATDSGGTVYDFPPGSYRFPNVAAGEYRLEVVPPEDYAFPSIVEDADLQSLPGAPYALSPASRGENFTLADGAAFEIDLPADPQPDELFITKTVSKSTVAIGEFVQYAIGLTNPAVDDAAVRVAVVDKLPVGFRYQNGSSMVDGDKIADPQISRDGRTLTYDIGTLDTDTSIELRYVVSVTSGARSGKQKNAATAVLDGTVASETVYATVHVREDLFRSKAILMGRVVISGCDVDPEDAPKGLAGVRVYLEDGTFVITDDDGRWHIEDVTPGTHVVQLDMDGLTEDYNAEVCNERGRFGGRGYSQFVDVSGGTIWRADFHLTERSPPDPKVRLKQTFAPTGEGAAHVELELENDDGIDLAELDAVYQVPEGWRLVEGSARVNGLPSEPVSDVLGLRWKLQPDSGQRVGFDLVQEASTSAASGVAYGRFRTADSAYELTGPARVFFEGEVRTGSPRDFEARSSGGFAPADDDLEFDPAAPPGASSIPDVSLTRHGFISHVDGQRMVNPTDSVRARLPKKLRPRLSVDGVEVSNDRIGLVAVDEQNDVRMFTYVGVEFGDPGVHELKIQGIDPFGGVRFEEVLEVLRTGEVGEIRIVGGAENVADGESPMVLYVEVFDTEGEIIDGGVTLGLKSDDLAPLGWQSDATLSNPATDSVGVSRDGAIYFDPVNKTGRYQGVLTHNDVQARFELYAKPQKREWIVVGLAEGQAGYNDTSGDDDGLDAADEDDDVLQDSRFAFFAKGTFREDWLITASYDTDSDGKRGLFEEINPAAYYQLYGDETSQAYDAASSDDLYLRVDRDQFYAMYGDFETQLDKSELAEYDRSLTGFKTEYFGERFNFNVFATDTKYAFMRDEIRGDGTSGLYQLSNGDIVDNSDEIWIEVRDRFRSEIVIATTPLTRYIDYNIDYETGELYFKKPVPSKDQNLNPVYIVAEYETEDGGRDFSGGGRVGMRIDDLGSEMGITYIREGSSEGKDSDMFGVDLNWQINEFASLHGEYGHTNSKVDGDDQDADAFVFELLTVTENFEAKGYYRELENDYGLGHQSSTQVGTMKYGVDMAWKFADQYSFTAEAFRDKNLETHALRHVGDFRIVHENDLYDMYTGVLFARESDVPGRDGNQDTAQLLAGGSAEVIDNLLKVHVDSEISITGGDTPENYPNRVVFGGDLAITRWAAIVAEQEFTWADQEDTNGTRVGLRLQPWTGAEANTTVEREGNENGGRTFANLGLLQSWQVNENLAVDFSVDRSQTIDSEDQASFNDNVPSASGTTEDFTAVSVGGGYNTGPWEWVSRIEFRSGDDEDKWNYFGGMLRELHKGVSLSAAVDLTDSDGSGNDYTKTDVRAGVAYRPFGSRWIILDRLDLLLDDQKNDSFDTKSRRIVNNFNANYRFRFDTQVAFQYGAKFAVDTIDDEKYEEFTDLIGGEIRHNLTKEWDFGVQGSILHSWDAENYDFSVGASVGYSPVDNTWISLGYNFTGFRDDDFTNSKYTAKGVFIKFRVKFDQDTIRKVWGRWED
jgi:uncharacterized repeat protein (TIGR01451 family)